MENPHIKPPTTDKPGEGTEVARDIRGALAAKPADPEIEIPEFMRRRGPPETKHYSYPEPGETMLQAEPPEAKIIFSPGSDGETVYDDGKII